MTSHEKTSFGTRGPDMHVCAGCKLMRTHPSCPVHAMCTESYLLLLAGGAHKSLPRQSWKHLALYYMCICMFVTALWLHVCLAVRAHSFAHCNMEAQQGGRHDALGRRCKGGHQDSQRQVRSCIYMLCCFGWSVVYVGVKSVKRGQTVA